MYFDDGSDDDDEELTVRRGDLKRIFGLWAHADNDIRDRLFIIQVAADDGWGMAKQLAVMKSGIENADILEFV